MTEFLLAAAGFALGFFIKNFAPGYLSKKGKNLATKQDIKEITQKIETVRHEYSKNLESTRAELSSKIGTHGFRYEKEFEILSTLTALLVEARDSCFNLRPEFEMVDTGRSKEDIKVEKLTNFYNAFRELYKAKEKSRPFYSSSLYEKLSKIDGEMNLEAIQYRHKEPFSTTNFVDYWKEAEKNRGKISTLTDEAMQEIRERVSKWESLPLN